MSETYTSLKNCVEKSKATYLKRYNALNWMWYDEGLVWAIQDYLGCKGEFTKSDVKYLKECGFTPEDFIDS